ncbi:MAG: hypothetical protein ABFD85_07455 [Phycisphaerae bacterium]
MPTSDSATIGIETGIEEVGPLQLWAPEGIATDTGFSSIYPFGQWRGDERRLVQEIEPPQCFAPQTNIPKIDPQTMEYDGIRFPVDQSVRWRTVVEADNDSVRYAITLTNLGQQPMVKPGAAICTKFLDGSWWSLEDTFVFSGGRRVSLAQLGRGGGRANEYQAFLMKGQTYNHEFYKQFWGFNAAQLDQPTMIAHNQAAGVCIAVSTPAAWFIHNNKGNPCMDMMIAFGKLTDPPLAPGQSATAEGSVAVLR